MKNTKFYNYLWSVVICTLLFSACSKDDDNSSPQEAPLKNKTVLAYFVGDISLWFCIEESVNKLEAGWQDDLDGNLLIYLDHSPHLTQFSSPVLLKVRHDETDRIVSEVVKTYPDQDAGDPKVMHNVLSDVLEMYPAQSHGLIIGTHGSGAAPGSITEDPHATPDTRAICGSDRYDSQLEIYQLAELLPIHYEFILFHACLMGNVETAYALKDKCDFMVASSEPLPGPALPYDIITPYFFTEPQADFYHVLDKSTEWYDALPDDEYQPLTLSVTRTDKLDLLAAATKPLIKRYSTNPTSFYNKMNNAYEYGMNDESPSMFYDMKQVVSLQMEEATSPTAEEYAFRDALNAAVPLVCASKTWETEKLDIEDICGLSCYIPFADEQYEPFNTFFKTHYGWIEAAGIDLLM